MYPEGVLIVWIAAHVAVTVLTTVVLPVIVVTVMALGGSRPTPIRAVTDRND